MKTKVAILGTGLIGTDLLIKVIRSKYLKCIMFAGQRKDSPGIIYAKKLGIPTSTESIKELTQFPLRKDIDVIFDATNAKAHLKNSDMLRRIGFVIDITPSNLGYMCVPELNLKAALKKAEVSLISCGAQVLIPKIIKIKNLEYIEVVTAIASKSAGIGTRNNIDEYVRTTANAITKLCKVPAKAILIINPAEPPITMHNTIYAKIKGQDKIKVIQYTVEGEGDYLPKYSGNLDAINKKAIVIAEAYAKNKAN